MKIDLITSCQRKAACMQNNIENSSVSHFGKNFKKKKKKKNFKKHLGEHPKETSNIHQIGKWISTAKFPEDNTYKTTFCLHL